MKKVIIKQMITKKFTHKIIFLVSQEQRRKIKKEAHKIKVSEAEVLRRLINKSL